MKEFNEKLEVALSGGGFRATAFTLGVLLYLAHSGLNRRVVTISSVSGGSITNGFVARECDFAVDPLEVFKDVASRLAKKVCGQGKYRGFWLVSRSYLCLLGFSGLALIIWGTAIAVPLLAQLVWGVTLKAISSPELASFAIAVLLWGVAGLCRGYVIGAWMSFTFFRGDLDTLGSVSTATADHVFCATDLTNSGPVFFSTKGGGRTFSEHYGRGDARSLKLSRVVQASAAFPPVVPPMRFTRNETRGGLGFEGTGGPLAIYLSDGGVWNNLGTDWSRLRSDLSYAEFEWTKQKNQSASDLDSIQESTKQCPTGGVLLIANASKPEEMRRLFAAKIPFISFFAMLARVINVTVNSTVAARAVDIEETAQMRMLNNPDRWELGRDAPQPSRMVWGESAGSDKPLAVLIGIDRLPGETAVAYEMIGGLEQWQDRPGEYVKESKASIRDLDLEFGVKKKDVIPTTLDNLGEQDTLRMIVLGYLNTRETLTVAFANHNPPPIPDSGWFHELLKIE